MFELSTDYKLTGDQPKVINEISQSILQGNKHNTLLGVTGSGKTFCMANIIKNVNKPTLIISHNKTLAAQLYSEFKDLFPNNAVEYFVSHFKHFQPECYMPVSDKYIAKETVINEDIERMRQHCVQSLMTRKDVIVVASVSALFGLGNPKTFYKTRFVIKKNQTIDREDILKSLVQKQYERTNDILKSGKFRVAGDVIDIMLSIDEDIFYRIEMFGDEIERISKIDINTLKTIEDVNELNVFNISSYIAEGANIDNICNLIKEELDSVYQGFMNSGDVLYAQRISDRTNYDIEMIKEIGYCKNMEVYQRYLTDRPAGSAPYSLLDFFPKDYLMFIDESHATIPQVKSIGGQNVSIKDKLIKYGFRLPSCVDNRPLTFNEFESMQDNVVYVSATPAEYELNKSIIVSEQLIRPTGILDPIIDVRPTKGQIDDVYSEINKTIEHGGKTLITVLTKNMAETLTDYLRDLGIKACYLHSNVATIDRVDTINKLQQDRYDVLIGCNLLREGLSISNCELVIILDADKEGFLRNKTSLLQTIGRAARNINGRAILYADVITGSMREAIDTTNRHREIQMRYNEEHNIIPKNTEMKLIKNIVGMKSLDNKINNDLSLSEIDSLLKSHKKSMEYAAKNLDFEEAIRYRDLIMDLEIQKKQKSL